MTPDTLQQPAVRALIQQTAEVLGAPLDDAAIEYKIPDEMMRSLREDVFVFSGFKTYHQLKEASELLRDSQGRVKSFNQFYQDVSAIREKYNRNWLHAEYNFAVASSQMAARWAEQSADADICDLTYSTAGDDKVRPDHAALDGVTLPVEDPFWSYAYPPNGWNCRCNVIRSLKGTRPLSDSERCQETFMQTTEGREEIFRYNPGRDKVIFPPHHPYYGKRGYKHCLNPHLATSLGDNLECKIAHKTQAPVKHKYLTDEQKRYRKKLQEEAIEKYNNKVIHNEVDILITKRGIKEFLNQPHAQYFAKNELIRDLPSLIESAKYLGRFAPKAGKEKIVATHLFEVLIEGKQNSLIVLEDIKGRCVFHSVSDSIDTTKGL